MKRNVRSVSLVIALVGVPGIVAASHVKTGTTKGTGRTEIEACEDAKRKAHLNHCEYGTLDKHVGSCRCGRTVSGFECIVDYKDECRDKDEARSARSDEPRWFGPGGLDLIASLPSLTFLDQPMPAPPPKQEPTAKETVEWLSNALRSVGTIVQRYKVPSSTNQACNEDWETKHTVAALSGECTIVYEWSGEWNRSDSCSRRHCTIESRITFSNRETFDFAAYRGIQSGKVNEGTSGPDDFGVKVMLPVTTNNTTHHKTVRYCITHDGKPHERTSSEQRPTDSVSFHVEGETSPLIPRIVRAVEHLSKLCKKPDIF